MTPETKHTTIRETANYRAIDPGIGKRLIIEAKDPKSYPRRKAVTPAQWRTLHYLSDAEFDGTCVLELGIGCYQKDQL